MIKTYKCTLLSLALIYIYSNWTFIFHLVSSLNTSFSLVTRELWISHKHYFVFNLLKFCIYGMYHRIVDIFIESFDISIHLLIMTCNVLIHFKYKTFQRQMKGYCNHNTFDRREEAAAPFSKLIVNEQRYRSFYVCAYSTGTLNVVYADTFPFLIVSQWTNFDVAHIENMHNSTHFHPFYIALLGMLLLSSSRSLAYKAYGLHYPQYMVVHF